MEVDQTAELPLTTSQFYSNFLKSKEYYLTDPIVFFSNNLWLADQTATNSTTSVSSYIRLDQQFDLIGDTPWNTGTPNVISYIQTMVEEDWNLLDMMS